jgi:tryptophan halogenase
LIKETLKEPFESYSDLLPNDSAWATRIPYKNKKKELVPYTNCTAIENGWVWNIPLWSRMGTGYVYSSKFVDDETALKQLQKHLGTKDLDFKNIKMRVGIHKRLWVKNVAAIGLAAGFIEPLESNGLYSVHEFLFSLVRNLEREHISQWDKDNFTFQCKSSFRNFAEFVAFHYALTQRTDTPYWKANFNKTWEEKLINLESTPLQGFHKYASERAFTYYHDQKGGSHAISAGMNWAPTTLNSVVWITKLSKENLSKQFWQQKVNELDNRKKLWEKAASKDLSFYDFMLKNIYQK